MARLPILPDNDEELASYLFDRQLPSNYMADFSIMGFVVDSVEQALPLLVAQGFTLHQSPTAAEIQINSLSDVPRIHDLLLEHNIEASFRDVAETIYQA